MKAISKNRFDVNENPVAAVVEQATGKPESELRAAARLHGLTMKELAAGMGVSASYLSQVSTGRRPWSPVMREKVMQVLGEVPGQGAVYRQGGVVTGESSYIRERARSRGMSMQELAERSGVSYGYMTQVSRGRRSMGVKYQKRVEAALEAPAPGLKPPSAPALTSKPCGTGWMLTGSARTRLPGGPG